MTLLYKVNHLKKLQKIYLWILHNSSIFKEHYHLEVQANPQKKLDKKPDAIFSIYGRNGINPWFFFLILT